MNVVRDHYSLNWHDRYRQLKFERRCARRLTGLAFLAL